MSDLNENIWVIGIGSSHGADNVGWRCVYGLRQTFQGLQQYEHITFKNIEFPMQLVTEEIENVDRLILVDAVSGNNTYGSLVVLCADEILKQSDTRSSSGTSSNSTSGNTSNHGMSVSTALEMIQSLYQGPKETKLLGIDINERFDDLIPNEFEKILYYAVMDELVTHKEGYPEHAIL